MVINGVGNIYNNVDTKTIGKIKSLIKFDTLFII